MMHLLDYLETMDPKDLDREAFSDYFLETFEEGKTLIREIVDAFFPVCGVDREGNPISASREKRAALPSMLGNAFLSIEKKYGITQKILVPVVINRTASIVERMVLGASRGKMIEGVYRFRSA